ncbi:MAG: DUF4382 domain-containing protein [Proteobacteria bacterium]|nr:DUF4382 domain-containing protein [Pseudomonadota bacterium]
MTYRIPAALLALAATAGTLLAGCSARTEVSQSGNAPAMYSHVYVTTQEVWFNTNGTAGADDPGWQKFTLSAPTTVDIVGDENGTLGTIADNVNLVAGTYNQIRLIPLDSTASLAVSAQAAGAIYNAEADYVDSSGNTQQVRLELLNPDKGIGVPGSLRVPIGKVGTTSTGSTATSTAGTALGVDSGTGTASSTSTTSSTTTIASFTVNIDGVRDLVPFTYYATPTSAGTAAVMLSSHAGAYDLSQVGGIQGTLTLTNLTSTYTGVSGLPDIQATAETLSADGSRHEVVLSTAVHSDGTFLLYPLPINSSNPVYYDVVIHGGGIATIIVKNVELNFGSSSSSSSSTTSTTSSASTTALTAAAITSTGSNDTTTITPPSLATVSIGTLIPRAATTYTANIATASSSLLPSDTLVGFYQTLRASGEVPYVIESATLDPFNQDLFTPITLSSATVDSGTYVASGETVTLVSGQPVQGTGKYTVAGTAPNYADGALSPVVGPPSSGTAVQTVTVPGLTLAPGATAGSVVAAITPPAGGKWTSGVLLVSHEGALVAQVKLDSVLAAGGGSVTAIVPAGTASSLYYVSVRVWNSVGTPSRQWYDTPIDLRSSTSGSVAVTIN